MCFLSDSTIETTVETVATVKEETDAKQTKTCEGEDSDQKNSPDTDEGTSGVDTVIPVDPAGSVPDNNSEMDVEAQTEVAIPVSPIDPVTTSAANEEEGAATSQTSEGDDVSEKSTKELPFQIQISYTDLEGNKALRVLTQTRRVTNQRRVAEQRRFHFVFNGLSNIIFR